jgi:SAM-dependent methyltransferase
MPARFIPTDSVGSAAAESCKPIPVRMGDGRAGRIVFALRRTVDLQLATICWFLVPRLATMRGDVLDVGCGDMPFRPMLPVGVRYRGIDVAQAGGFGMASHRDVTEFDGVAIPFADRSFDHILCTEVLEHAEEPARLIAEMRRVLRPGGTLVATIPFSARVHHAPYDYHRFTVFQLRRMFADFPDAQIDPRGNDVAVIANKLIVLCMRLASSSAGSLWRLPLLLVTGPVALLFLTAAHVALRFGWGSTEDPLGYAITATRD